MFGFCEEYNEHSATVREGENFEQIGGYYFLKIDISS
jgi:hypothetical protein